MKILKKIISTAVCAAAMLSISANAYAIAEPLALDHYKYMGTPVYTDTSGGVAGYVTIRSRVFTNVTQPASNIYVYSCGVISDISTSKSLKTYFSITGSLYSPSNSVNISDSRTGNSAIAQATDDDRKFDYCHSVTTTYSVAFGDSTMECNRAIKY